jgi:hypothetical protein
MHALLKTLACISDDDLLQRLKRLAHGQNVVTAYLVAHLAEMEHRGLHLDQGYSSLFAYCTQVLHLSESSAYRRIEAARAVRRCPILLERLADGSLHLTAVLLLGEHLDSDRHIELIELARHRSRREIEELIATFHPLPPVPSLVRKLPGPRATAMIDLNGNHDAGTGESLAGLFPVVQPASSPVAPVPPSHVVIGPRSAPVFQRRAVIAPLSRNTYKMQFTMQAETHRKFRQVQNLIRHQIPDGDPAKIFDQALTILFERLIRQKFAATDRARKVRAPSRRSRRIPAEVRRTVWARDQGQCAFRGIDGHRCAETGRLEFHHVKPFALGGESTLENIELRCRAHNAHEAKGISG